MGMYDNLIINPSLLPISDEEKQLLGENPDWQTTAFSCILSLVEITQDGRLRIKYIMRKWDKNAISALYEISGLKGALVDVSSYWADLDEYHGSFSFYTSDKNGDMWVFKAKFTDGQLVEIVRG